MKVLRKLICLFFILVFLLNFLSIETNNYQNFINEKGISKNELLEENQDSLKVQGISSILQDPYTVNFSKMWTFFRTNFKSPLKYDIPLYVSESDNTGTVTDDSIFSLDNLLLYKSLLQQNYDEYDTFDAYLDLQSTPLWQYYNITQYGFVKSINGSTGEIIDVERYLIDNLMPIFLLLENIGNEIGNININGNFPRNSIIQMFSLINSSEFWDSTNEGFYETNSSIAGDKDIKSNLYAVLANFMIYKYKSSIADTTVSNSAYEKAKLTMWKLVNQTWDSTNEGFYYKSDDDWTPFTFPSPKNYKYLSVNALGILALLEYWIMTGMKSNSIYYNMSVDLFNRLNRDSNTGSGNGGLWNTNYNAYETYCSENWDPLSVATIGDETINLEANALMMLACLRLFEVTGNFTYYDRAITLFESLRKYFYNTDINAHRISINEAANPNILLHSNLRLCEAYLKAFEIYNSTTLETVFSHTEHPNYIMNQDDLDLTSDFKFEKDLVYYESGVRQEKTITYDNIIGANITYIFRYPNDTIKEIRNDFFKKNNISIQYEINSSLPFGDGYEIDIYANWTYFGFAFTYKEFNVKSGLQIDWESELSTLKQYYYQGEQANFSIGVHSDYNNNLTLNVSLSGKWIRVDTPLPANITFVNNSITVIEFNITILDNAPTEKVNITFIFEANTTLYLKDSREIEIKNALSYSNLIYSKKVVAGNSVKLFVDLINQSPNVTQTFNLIFSGTYCRKINSSITLTENEIRAVSYLIGTESVIKTSSIKIYMSISIGKTIFYTETITVEIVPSLEITSIEFPEKVKQGTNAYFIIYIKNNQENSEEFTLFINEEEVDTKIDELYPGENRIEYNLVPTWNPYEIGKKTYIIEIEDSSGEVVYKDYFEYEIEVSAINLICFYVLPILILLGIILYFKNKEIKHKLLRR